MKIQYCSDLHLEFPDNKEYLKNNPINPIGDILILAGDIIPMLLIEEHSCFIDELAAKFDTVYWLLGNHEYYYYNMLQLPSPVHKSIRPNVFLVNNVSVVKQHVKFVFTTLWSHIRPQNQFYVQQRLSDFQVIGNGRDVLQPEDYKQLHKDSLSFLKKEMKQSDSKKHVVVTHHVPTYEHYPARYKGGILNEAFATELGNYISKSKADYWIYGHHHHNPEDFMIGKTTLVTNQLGYVKSNEHLLFDSNKIIQIN
ncbi:MAG: metallophosphoesterase [Bacteroidetes bacterium GWA2_30_7]|nr:MAG: metallophosphoesterase [Bacteroidetes bacterium GWA2_30_7]